MLWDRHMEAPNRAMEEALVRGSYIHMPARAYYKTKNPLADMTAIKTFQ